MIKLTVIQNIVVPYEIPLYRGLAEREEVDLKVYFCARTYRDRRWRVPEIIPFSSEVLEGFTIEIQSFISSLNPSIMERLRKEKPDVVMLSGSYANLTMQLALLYCMINDIPVVYRSDENLDTRMASTWIARLASNLVEKRFVRKCDALVCPGSSSRAYHAALGASPRKVFISPYTTANDDLYVERSRDFRSDRARLRQRTGIGEERVIVFVGQFIERKGIEYLLTAYEELKQEVGDLALVLVGDGPLIDIYRKYCLSKGFRSVYFPGFVTEEEKIMYYSIADVFVLPSLKDQWGLVVNEAMLCGLPVVVTESTGASEMVTPNENGFIVATASSSELRVALRKILLDRRLASLMGKNSFKIVRTRFTLQNRIEGVVSAVKYALEKQRRD